MSRTQRACTSVDEKRGLRKMSVWEPTLRSEVVDCPPALTLFYVPNK